MSATARRPGAAVRLARGLLVTTAGGLAVAALALGAWLGLSNWADGVDTSAASPPSTPRQIERGADLARAGNCMACHSAPGAEPWSGGRGIDTPFGTVYAGNLTPDPETGLGRWNAAEFWRALHHGRSRDGRLLTPAFPYTSFTRVTREDSDALFAYLRSLPAVRAPARPHELRFPYDTQLALAAWRALYFRPGTWTPDPGRDAEWNRGAYLVRGLGHCAACHAPRNRFGAPIDADALTGARIEALGWYAPSLHDPRGGGIAEWPLADAVQWLRSGYSERAQASGPMVEVIQGSTQHLSTEDLRAIATYLRALPGTATAIASAASAAPSGAAPASAIASATAALPPASATPAAAHPSAARGSASGPPAAGARLYARHCAECHGEQGEGVRGAYPAFAGNRALGWPDPANLIQTVLYGGFGPATMAHPQPFGMPPFVLELSDAEVAAVLSHIRARWAPGSGEISALQVQRLRGLRQSP